MDTENAAQRGRHGEAWRRITDCQPVGLIEIAERAERRWKQQERGSLWRYLLAAYALLIAAALIWWLL